MAAYNSAEPMEECEDSTGDESKIYAYKQRIIGWFIAVPVLAGFFIYLLVVILKYVFPHIFIQNITP